LALYISLDLQTFIEQIWKSRSRFALAAFTRTADPLGQLTSAFIFQQGGRLVFLAVIWCGKKYVSPRITQRSGISIRAVNSESAKLVLQTKAASIDNQ